MFTKRSAVSDVPELTLRDGVPPRMVLPAEFDLQARRAQAEEQARIDAASGAYDQIAIEALTKLPYEQQIDDEIQMLQSGAADRLPAPLTADLEQTGASGQAHARRVREQDLLDGEREKRRDLSRVLNGEKLGKGEVDWSDTDPAAPTSNGYWRTILRGEVLRTWMITFGLTALLLAAETYVMMRNVKMFIRGETEVFSLVLALVLALIMTALPHAVGAAVITSRRRGWLQAKEKWTILLLTPTWLFVGLLIGILRTEAAERHAVLSAAADLDIAPDQVDVSTVFNSTVHLALWTSIALGHRFRLVRGQVPHLQPVPGPGRQAGHRDGPARPQAPDPRGARRHAARGQAGTPVGGDGELRRLSSDVRRGAAGCRRSGQVALPHDADPAGRPPGLHHSARDVRGALT